MRKKNTLEFVFIALFIMCIALALVAALDYNTRATEREFLNQAKYALFALLFVLVCFIGARLVQMFSVQSSTKLRNVIWIVLSLAFLAAGFYLRMRVIQNIVLDPESDFETYYRIANHLINGTLLTPEGEADRQYIALYPHTIGFPLFILVPAFRLFGVSVQNALYANLFCSMISVLLVGYIAKHAMGKGACVISIAMMSLWPSFIYYGTMVASEPGFTMLLLIGTALLMHPLERDPLSLYARSPGRLIPVMMLAGVFLALAAAVRPMAIIFLAAWAVMQFVTRDDLQQETKTNGTQIVLSRGWFCIALVAVSYLITGTVITNGIKNIIMETPVSGLKASGYNLMVGLNSSSQGLWNETDADFFADTYDATGSAAQAHSISMQVALDRALSEPENILNLIF